MRSRKNPKNRLAMPATAISNQWGGLMYNWLAGRGWLLRPVAESPFAYVHVFISGAPVMSAKPPSRARFSTRQQKLSMRGAISSASVASP